MRIYINPKTKKYYGVDLECSCCSKEIIGEMAMLHYCWFAKKTKRPSKAEILCVKCADKKEKLYQVEETYMVICLPEAKMPAGLEPWIHIRCELTDSKKISVFDAAEIKAEKTIDRTRYAGRESFEGAKIGVDPHQAIEQTDSRVADPLKFLKGQKEAKPILPGEGQEMLE